MLRIPFINGLSEKSESEISKEIENSGALINIDKVNWPDEFPDNRETRVYCAHDGINIVLLFKCTGMHLKAVVDEDLGPVASDSCVEFFVQPDPSSPRYWNFEFNAIGRKNVSTRIVRSEPRRLSKEELAQIKTFPSVGRETFDEKFGLHEWSLLTTIPLELINVHFDGKPIEMHGNFYKCGGKTSSPHYLSWHPIKTDEPDFHRLEFFGKITLG